MLHYHLSKHEPFQDISNPQPSHCNQLIAYSVQQLILEKVLSQEVIIAKNKVNITISQKHFNKYQTLCT